MVTILFHAALSSLYMNKNSGPKWFYFKRIKLSIPTFCQILFIFPSILHHRKYSEIQAAVEFLKSVHLNTTFIQAAMVETEG